MSICGLIGAARRPAQPNTWSDENVTDFSGAATRHWNDAEHLRSSTKNDNADQLYGVAAECAIKSAIVSKSSIADKDLPKPYWGHINELWEKASIQTFSRSFPAMALILKEPNPFSDWTISQRYCSSGTVTAAALENHRDATRKLMSAVQFLGTRRT